MRYSSKRDFDSQSLLKIGSIVKTHGLQGEVVLAPLAGVDSIYYEMEEVICVVGGQAELLAIRKIRPHKGRFIVRFEEISSIEEGERIKDSDLFVELDKLSKGIAEDLFLRQSEGSAVFTADGAKIGIIRETLYTPAHPVLVILTEEGKELMIPSVSRFVGRVDIEKREIVVNPPEGIFDIYDI